MSQEIILKTKFWTVDLVDDQAYLGRCHVSLNRDCGTLSDLTNEEWLDFSKVIEELEKGLKKSFDATMFNWACLMNHAYKEKNPNPYVHWHFRPRYNHEVAFQFGQRSGKLIASSAIGIAFLVTFTVLRGCPPAAVRW